MENVHEEPAGAEHPGFLQKIKDKLHIGHHKEKEASTTTISPETTDTAVSSKSVSVPPTPVEHETVTSDAQGGEFFDSEEVFSKAQQGESHDGVPTFLVALPDKDMPDEGTIADLHHVTAGEMSEDAPLSSDKDLDSEEVFSNAQQGEHHGGVPTFMVALPEQEIPAEVNKQVSSDAAGK